MKEHRFGDRSRARLATCTLDLQAIAHRGLLRSPIDFTIIWGFRNMHEQNELVAQGLSKTPWPTSKHNNRVGDVPSSHAFDFGPWIDGTIPWNDTHAFAVVAGALFAAASELDKRIRWGGDWDRDGSTTDQTFMDWGHVELVP